MSIRSAIRSMQFGMPETKSKAPDPKSRIESHLQNAMTSHKKGNHAEAKKHTLKAVNALHQLTSSAETPATVATPGC
jgi:hypothetical protein